MSRSLPSARARRPARRSPTGRGALLLPLLFPSLLGALAALAGCGQPEGEPAEAGDAPAARAEAAPRPAPGATKGSGGPGAGGAVSRAAPAERLLFEERARPEPAWKLFEVGRLDPGVDGWESEVLHDRARAALEGLLAAALPPAGQGADPARFLAPDFEGATALRPARLEPVFDDGETRALRPAPLGAPAGAGLDPGAELVPLEEALASALAGFELDGWPAGEIASAFDLIDIEGGAGGFEVTALVELDGRAGDAKVQQNATWRVGLVETAPADDDAGRALVRWIRLLDFAEVRGARSLLGEHTRHLFGGQPCWEQEFRLGVDDYYFRQDKLSGNAFIGGQGLAVGDLDGDGLDDVYACQQGGLPNRMFMHRPDGTARDVAAELGLDVLDNTRSALIADFDGDGAQDLAIAVHQDVVVFYNDGRGTSFDARPVRGRGTEDIFSLTAADPDLDGDLDLYACRYVTGGIIGGVPTPYHDADNGASNLFFRNQGGRELVEDTREAGFMQNNGKFSLASIWDDLDRDGDLDLYVTNDFGRNNLFVNQFPRRFRDEGIERGADDMAAGMGASIADIDLDGWPDILITNMFSSPGLRIASMPEHFMGGAHREVHGHYVRHARGNTLLHNRGDGTFEDVTEAAGTGMGRWGWGALFVDLNNDGLEDIYGPNGFITNSDPYDVGSFFWRRVTAQSPPEAGEAPENYRNAWASIQHLVMVAGASWAGNERNCAFLNLGSGRFANVSALSAADYPDDARAAAAVDWDDDGRLDLLVKNRTAPRLRFLRGQATGGDGAGGPAHWLKLDLRGTSCNRDAIGAVAVVELEGRTLRQTLHAGEGYLAQSSKRLHFGLGAAGEVRAVSVEWPGGETEDFGPLGVDARWLLVQGSGAAEPVAARTHADFAALAPEVETRLDRRVDRAVLVDRMPMGPIQIPSFEDAKRKVKDFEGRPLLVEIWSSESAACLDELAQLAERRSELEAAGLALVPLTLDEGPALAGARRALAELGLDAQDGYVDGALMKVLEVVFVEVFGRIDPTPVPTSLLFDPAGQLAAIQRGPLELERLLEDARILATEEPTTSGAALTGGRWYVRGRRDYATLSKVFAELGRQRVADIYAGLAEAR